MAAGTGAGVAAVIDVEAEADRRRSPDRYRNCRSPFNVINIQDVVKVNMVK